ncbi:hypothetical protein FHL15_007563 [Xylaria flabelliformis]|uniref:Uncharacterized protein n=1 Tax=Xylaria flabelliformis TaxID=2512241 RepID=A0A553HUD2_9PEZI|nr:hypothetical protein FHL15_007563 [Xylaria flabelliformis]
MAFGGDIEMDDVVADDELLPFTDSEGETYSSDEEEVGPVSKSLGFVSDEKVVESIPNKKKVVELVPDKKESVVAFAPSEDEKEQSKQSTIRPKLTFKQRLAPLVRHKDEKFQKIESYFFSLLRTPGVSIDDILQGTFDDHEITLITPQSGPPDLVDWQRRNAHRYYENLETRFKGATDTLAFKLTCLYFGFPVEPLRMGTLPFLLPPDPEPLDAKKAAFNADPLAFLNKYNTEEKFVYDESILSLRGGGGASKDENEKKKKHIRQKINKAIREVTPKGDEMDFDWISKPTSKMHKPPTSNSAAQLRIYGWQGAINTSLNYVDFVATVDKLTSNRKDRSICVEIWQVSPLKLVQTASGTLFHLVPNPPGGDQIWELVQKYFGQGEDQKHACFVRFADDGEATVFDRPGGYQPRRSERGVVRIEHTVKKDVAYMRVPQGIIPEHKPHQFSAEYTLAMQVLFPTGLPHAWVLYQHGFIGATYQYLDPPGGLWEQVIDSRHEWSSIPTISFTLDTIDPAVTPVIVPGAFTSRKLPELDRKDFKLTNSFTDSRGLGKVYKAVELSVKNVNLKKECSGFEVWCPAAEFKDVTQQPAHIPFSGNMANLKSLEGWQALLGSGVVPDGGFALVVRPVYKTYRLQKFTDDKKVVDLQLNNYDLAQFRSFVRNRLYAHFNYKKFSHVIVLRATNQESFQAELTIQRDTTEEQWQWIRRNIVEPELTVSVENLGNEWSIQENSWGPRYAVGSVQAKLATEPSKAGFEKSSSPIPDEFSDHESVNSLFKDSWEGNEAERMRLLRDRTFTSVNSIFTNPLKPVMPLHGPPLESIIKTGPSMPGVSIAMLTPTEVLRLQHEVHSLRFQLLDRTRECPYADCNRYFTFDDADGLDKHVREDHYVLRCFLCDKNKHLFPYYSTDQIKKHFVSEHVNDILTAYGAKGVVEGSDEDVSEEDSLVGSALSDTNTDVDMADPSFVASVTSSDTSSSDTDMSLSPIVISNKPAKKPEQAQPPTTRGMTEKQKLDEAVKKYKQARKDEDIWEQLAAHADMEEKKAMKDEKKKKKEEKETVKPSEEVQPPTAKIGWEKMAEDMLKQAQQTVIARETTAPAPTPIPVPETTPKKVLLASQAFGPSPAERRKKREEEKKKKEKETVKSPVPTTSTVKSPAAAQQQQKDVAKPAQVAVVDPKTEPNFSIYTAYNPNYNKSTVQEASQWIKDAVDRHIADGGTKHVSALEPEEAKWAALRKVNQTPGTWQENLAFIKKQLDEYVALGGKLPSDNWPASVTAIVDNKAAETTTTTAKEAEIVDTTTAVDSSEKKLAPAFEAILAGLAAQTIIKNTTEDKSSENQRQLYLRKRKRLTTNEGEGSDGSEEPYEYSERSAVSDPPADLAAQEPSPSKKQRSDSGNKKGKAPAVVITRTGRAVKPSRAAREAAATGSEDSDTLGSEESSEFEFGMENIERKLRK